MRLHIVGSGLPTPAPDRFGSCFLVEVAGSLIMFDCGPASTYKMVRMGLSVSNVDAIFFTHHHFDHDADYGCFILTRWDQSTPEQRELRVYGPSPTVAMTSKLVGPEGAFWPDIYARLNHEISQNAFKARGGRLPRRAPDVKPTDVKPGIVARSAGWRVTAAVAKHVQPFLDSLAYRLDSDEGSIVFTGDTEPCDEVVELASGADALVTMCCNDEATMTRQGLTHGQCGTLGAAEMARAASVREVILVHSNASLAAPGAMEGAIATISSIYSGAILFGKEMLSIDIGRDSMRVR